MAITTSKVTYSLKPETVDRVQELATLWGVAKSEVIRRAVDKLPLDSPKVRTPFDALDSLEKNGISHAAAVKYIDEIRRERRAWGRRKK